MVANTRSYLEWSVNKSDITALLQQLSNGNALAADVLAPSLYEDLRRIAHRQRRRWRGEPGLQTTALLHEAWLKVGTAQGVDWASREHFFAVCTRAMRQILLNHAEKRLAAKRGDGAVHESLDGVGDLSASDAELVLTVQHAVDGLRSRSPRLADVVEYRVYGGFTIEETAELLGVSPRTVKREWSKARLWLASTLTDEQTQWPAFAPI